MNNLIATISGVTGLPDGVNGNSRDYLVVQNAKRDEIMLANPEPKVFSKNPGVRNENGWFKAAVE